jgi:aminoacrylate hydrolase
LAEAEGLYFEDVGRGPVLILSSGLGGSGSYWAPNIAALAQNYRVITYDHRGTGRSDRHVEGDLTLEAMGEDVILLLDALGIERATLIGHAIGGMAGLAACIAHPWRLQRIVTINGWARLDPHTARCFDTRMTLLRQGARPYLHAQPLFLYPPQWISDHHDRLQAEEEVHLAHFPGEEMVTRRIAAARRFNIADRLARVTARTLFVASEDDMLVPPSCSALMAKRIARAQLATMPKGGHAVNVTRPDDFNMWLLGWLQAK